MPRFQFPNLRLAAASPGNPVVPKWEFVPAHDLSEVVERLSSIMADTEAVGSPLGYFAALYRQVTLQVQAGIDGGEFEDGPRMVALDTAFANRYLKAFHEFPAGRPVTDSWSRTFDAASDDDVTILQHLVLGMNAHINLDLAVAAEETMRAQERPIGELERDFNLINRVLERLLDPAQEAVEEFSPTLEVLDRWGLRTDEMVFGFSIQAARKLAWTQAGVLDASQNRVADTERLDAGVARVAKLIARPPLPARHVTNFIRLSESRQHSAIIRRLGAITPF